jgi:hypothetical protein
MEHAIDCGVDGRDHAGALSTDDDWLRLLPQPLDALPSTLQLDVPAM